MKMIKPMIISASILLSASLFADENKHEAGEKLYKSNCAACHSMAAGGMDMNKRIAPPMAGVRMHYIEKYPDEASFVQAVLAWVEKQDESKSLMPGAIQKFKIMPPLSVSKEDAAKIAAYIYSGNIEKPEGLEKHMKEMHEKMGMQGQQHQGKHAMIPQKQMMARMRQQMMQMRQQQMQYNQQYNAKRMQMRQMMQKIKKGMQNRRGMNTMLMQQLNLSPQQKQKMQQLIQQRIATMQPLKQKLQQINESIRQLDTSNQNYKEQVFSLADQKSKLIYRMAIERGEKRWQIESILSPEQRAKFKQLRTQN